MESKMQVISEFKTIIILLLVGILITSCTGNENRGKVVLRVWQTETDKDAEAVLNNTIKEFKNEILAKEGQEVEVVLETISWNSLSSKLSVALQTGNEPDVCHLEPFMAYSLIKRGLIIPIDDVISEIEKNSKDTIYSIIRSLQYYEDKGRGATYGIAYALGVTGYAYRKDWANQAGIKKEPKTWNEFINFAKIIIDSRHNKEKILLPGGDPFFIDQLFAELLANNNGKLFDPFTFQPLLTSKEVIEVLQLFKDLKPYIYENWLTLRYLEQFNLLGKGEAAIVPVTYVRAVKSIQKQVENTGDKSIKANPDFFTLMQQPSGPSNYERKSYATVDCEPYVIFSRAAKIKTGEKTNEYYAKKFLEKFYTKENYLKFVQTVPIHLTPIFKGMATGKEYLSNSIITNWGQWQKYTTDHLNENMVRPIIMPDLSPEGRKIPFLLEFQAKNILTEAVIDVIKNNLEPAKAAKNAQEKTVLLLKSLGYKI